MDYGKVGYEAYCKHTGWKSLATGQDLPSWENLPAVIKMAWRYAADEIVSLALRIEDEA